MNYYKTLLPMIVLSLAAGCGAGSESTLGAPTGAAGSTASTGGTCSCPAGAQGPAGPEGPAGPAGLQGPKGDPGPAGGPAGPAGPQGLAGIQGVAGPKGDTGSPGMTGMTGAPGAPGAAGVQGIQGPKGDPGTIVKSQVYTVDRGGIPASGTGRVTVSAKCKDPSDIVLSGSCSTTTYVNLTTEPALVAFGQYTDATDNVSGWGCTYRSGSANTVIATVDAMVTCLIVP